MSKQQVDFSPLLITLNLFVVIVTLFLGYLIFGDYVDSPFRSATNIEQSTNSSSNSNLADEDQVVDGIHVSSGLIYAEGFDIVRGTCTACHSAKLITQNRADKEGWTYMIRWMQETQGLWDLGKNEQVIINYLATNYAPEEVGRRANLDVEAIEWYILELDK